VKTNASNFSSEQMLVIDKLVQRPYDCSQRTGAQIKIHLYITTDDIIDDDCDIKNNNNCNNNNNNSVVWLFTCWLKC